MGFKKVTAIVRSASLEKVEQRLQDLGVRGLTVTHVKGFGEYANFFRHDWLVMHERIEIFTDEAMAEVIVAAIIDVAHTGTAGDGVIAVLPVEEFVRIRTGASALGDAGLAGASPV